MASIGHLAVGLLGGRLARGDTRRPFVLMTALSFLPDADVIAFAFGIPYAHDFGHRGATHSIAFALLVGLVTWAVAARPRLGVLAALVTLSHPLLDALTDGGLGVALFWPLSSERIFFFWRPIPVAPIGAGFVSGRGMVVALTELVCFMPLFVCALWPRRTPAIVELDYDARR